MSRRTLLTCLALFLLSQAVFLPYLGAARGYCFDEVFYVPAARAFAHWTANTNRLHPPLGKYLIAVGIAIFGDTPFGWRFMSSIFGGLTVVGMYWFARVLFRGAFSSSPASSNPSSSNPLGSHELALWAALVALVNQMLYVMARTAQLDVFMFCFMLWGMVAFSAAFSAAFSQAGSDDDASPRRARGLLVVSGVLFGLATACKWLGVVPLGAAIALALLARGRLEGTRPRAAGLHTSRGADTGRSVGRVGLGYVLLALIVVPAVVYFLTFLPLLTLPPGPDSSVAGLWEHQFAIWHEHTTALGPVVQASAWYRWPLNTRPMWFWFERDGAGWARVVLLLGNPVVLWTAALAVLFCVWAGFKERARAALLIVVWFAALWLSWAVIPRRITYFYYYYPAAMVSTLALAFVVGRIGSRTLLGIPVRWVFFALALAVFLIELPFSSAMRVPLDWIRW